MSSSSPIWLLFFERCVACVFLIVLLPALLLVALLIHQVAGPPVMVRDELPSSDGSSMRGCFRFRTTGPGPPLFHAAGRFLRAYSVDELPGFWSVAHGDIRLRDFLRLI